MHTPKRILIIEDNPGISLVLAEVLSDSGHAVSIAHNGKEGLDLLINHELPDVILLDIFMPVINGVEFRKRQLQIPHLAFIPVIGMSADAYIKQRCLSCQITHYLKKPFELNELIEMIEAVVVKTNLKVPLFEK
jgi:CheY-like chemotaxis protein